jgi:hypothetical protein
LDTTPNQWRPLTPEDYVRNSCIRAAFLSAILGVSALGLSAQSWDAASQARSWAKQDKDDSFTFYDPAAKTLRTWMRDGGLLGSLPTAKLDDSPERWVLDPRNNAWVTHGSSVTQVDRTGHLINNLKLPAEVGDVCWDAKGFVLSYRAMEPYLEKRDFKGAVIWSFGSKPAKSDGPSPRNLHPIAMDDSGNVVMADSNALNLSVLDSNSGRKVSETNLLLVGGQPVPALEGSAIERGPLAIWPGKGVIFAAVKAVQIPAPLRAALQGLVLARLDLAQSRLEFLPTGLDESHILVGVLESDAIFVNPRGGLMLVKIK